MTPPGGHFKKKHAGQVLGELFSDFASRADWRRRRYDAILDAYIRSGVTGRSYQEERELLFAERGLGEIDE